MSYYPLPVKDYYTLEDINRIEEGAVKKLFDYKTKTYLDKMDDDVFLYKKLELIGEENIVKIRLDVGELALSPKYQRILRGKTISEFMLKVKIKLLAIKKNRDRKMLGIQLRANRVVIKANAQIKTDLIGVEGLYQEISNIFSLDNSTQKKKNYSKFETEKEIVQYIVGYNLIKFLGLKVKKKKRFQCILLGEGYTAWIDCDKKGHYRYFVKDEKNQALSFDLIDIIEMNFGCSFSTAVELLKENMKLKSVEGEWIAMLNARFDRNIERIKDAEKTIKPAFPVLYDYIEKYLFIYQELNIQGKVWDMKKPENMVDGECAFFSSIRHIAKFYQGEGEVSPATVARAINLFTALGFVKKVAEKEIPQDMKENFNYDCTGYQYVQNIACYIVPEINLSILREAEKRAKKFQNSKVTARNMVFDNLEKALGTQIALDVFKNTL